MSINLALTDGQTVRHAFSGDSAKHDFGECPLSGTLEDIGRSKIRDAQHSTPAKASSRLVRNSLALEKHQLRVNAEVIICETKITMRQTHSLAALARVDLALAGAVRHCALCQRRGRDQLRANVCKHGSCIGVVRFSKQFLAFDVPVVDCPWLRNITLQKFSNLLLSVRLHL